MAEILKGAPVALALKEASAKRAAELAAAGIVPTLAILRVGERPDDLSYERAALRQAAEAGITVRSEVLPADVGSEAFFAVLEGLNKDEKVHGILLFRPLPPQLDGEKARRAILPEKDVDGCTDGSLAGVFTGSGEGFPPCTAEAVMQVLDHYHIELSGKKALVLGRSLVIGKPAAMLLLARNATVSICHSKTKDLAALTREADVIVSATGRLKSLTADMTAPGQTVIDVAMNWDPEKDNSRGGKGALAGDADFTAVAEKVAAITPVPGGIGTVTTAVMLSHVIKAAEKKLQATL